MFCLFVFHYIRDSFSCGDDDVDADDDDEDDDGYCDVFVCSHPSLSPWQRVLACPTRMG